MARNSSLPRNQRTYIAHLAARLMAEDGITDMALAKRKAARLAGSEATRERLPSNEEVEGALRAYVQLYQAEEHTARLDHLRAKALEMMRLLEKFNPRLCGPVLEGSSGRYSNIDLHLFADSAKDFEFFLIDHGWEYRSRSRNVFVGAQQKTVAAFLIIADGADFDVSVFAPLDLKLGIRNSANGRALRHASIKHVSQLPGNTADT